MHNYSTVLVLRTACLALLVSKVRAYKDNRCATKRLACVCSHEIMPCRFPSARSAQASTMQTETSWRGLSKEEAPEGCCRNPGGWQQRQWWRCSNGSGSTVRPRGQGGTASETHAVHSVVSTS